MARNQSGSFGSRILNFIGLVDDRPQDNNYDNRGANDYSRAAYTPNRQRNEKRSERKSIPNQGSRSNYGSGRRDFEEDSARYSAGRRSVRFEEPSRSYEQRQSRSRFEEDYEQEAAPQPAPRQRPARENKHTVMFTLNQLKDANPVITSLIEGNTIIMTLDTDDAHLTERILDTLSGAVFALDATIRRASAQTYLLAPKSVNVKAADMDDMY